MMLQILDYQQFDWIATEKIDGYSMTSYVDPEQGINGVCSRQLDLLENDDNTLWKLAKEHKLHVHICETWPGQFVAVQGEAFGEGIQKNPLKVKGHHFAAFTLLVDGHEISRLLWPDWLLDIAVPTYDLTFPRTLEDALTDVDGLVSVASPGQRAEGVVWRVSDMSRIQTDGDSMRASFKVISNRYLLKHES